MTTGEPEPTPDDPQPEPAPEPTPEPDDVAQGRRNEHKHVSTGNELRFTFKPTPPSGPPPARNRFRP